MKRILTVLFAIALLSVAASATPILTMTFFDGTNTQIGPTVTGSNTVFFNGSVGAFNVALAFGTSNAPGGAFALVTQNDTIVQATSGSTANPAVLKIVVNAQGFSLPAADLTLSPNMALRSEGAWTGGQLSNGSTVQFQAFGDGSNGLYGSATGLCTLAGNGNVGASACPAEFGYFTRGTNDFSLTQVTTFSFVNAGDYANPTSNVTASPVPEPTSLPLLGAGLVSGAGFIRRKLF